MGWRSPPPPGAEADCFAAFLRRACFPVLARYPRAVIAFWVAVFAVSAAFGPKFLSETRSNLDVPGGTPSALATSAFNRLYPSFGSWPPAFVVQRSTDGGDVRTPPNATRAVAAALAAFAAARPRVVERVSGYWELESTPSLALLADAALSPARNTLMSTISWVPSATLNEVNDAVVALLPFVAGLSTPAVAVSTTGIFPLFSEVSATTESDFALIDAIVLPVAVVILGVRLQSIAHMGVALAALAITILLTFALLVPLAAPGVVDIAPFAPSIMLSLGISVCFDYSLFMLTRFREEVTARRRPVAGRRQRGSRADAKQRVSSADAEPPDAEAAAPSSDDGAAGAAAAVVTAAAVAHDESPGCVSKCRRGEGCGGGPGRALSATDTEDAVFDTLAGAGHVVLLSGATLACTFILLLAFSQNFLQSVGYACGFVVVVAIVVNLTLTPALLLALPCLASFSGAGACMPHSARGTCIGRISTCVARAWRIAGGGDGTDVAGGDVAAAAAPGAVTDLSSSSVGDAEALQHALPATASAADCSDKNAVAAAAVAAAEQHSTPYGTSGKLASSASCSPRGPRRRSFWFAFAWTVTGPRARWLVMAATALVTIPFLITVLQLAPTSDSTLIYLQGSSTLNTLHQIQSDFPIGALDPYEVIADTGVPGGVLTREYFAAEAALVAQVLATQGGYVDAASFTGLAFFRGAPVSFEQGSAWLNASAPAYNSTLGAAYRVLAASKVSETGAATLLTIETTVNPNSQAIVGFVTGMRTLLTSFAVGQPSPPLPLSLYLFGAYTTTLDVQEALFKLVPIQIGVVVAIVVVIVGVAFGSVGLALRLVATVSISLCWTFGLLVLVYQPGDAQRVFAAVTPSLLTSTGVYWVIPIMSFSILVGLALDYDIFLMSRVVEFRRAGWSDRAAVCLAVERTGGIITAAGLIMAVSFCGLLAPPLVVLNQYGLALFIGVVFDTFVMRPIVVPAVVAILGTGRLGHARANWWPRRMPEPKLSPDEEEAALSAGLWAPPM